MIVNVLKSSTKIMGRLSYPLKFLVISTLFILPLGVTMYLLITEADEKIRFAEMEKRGTQYLRPLRSLIQHLPEARLEEYLAAEAPSHKIVVDAIRKRIDEDFVFLKNTDKANGKALGTTEKSGALYRHWNSFKQETSRLSPMERDKRYIQLILALKGLITHTGNSSHLILEPDLDTYYLMNALLLRAPENMDTLGQLRIISAYILEKKGISDQGRAEFFRLYNTTENNLYEMQKGMEFVRKPILEKELISQNDAVMRFLRAFDEKIMRVLAPSANRAEMDALSSDALDKSFKLWDDAILEMDARLEQRIFLLAVKKNLTRGFYILALLAVAYFWLGFYRSVMNTIADFENAEKRMMSGDFDSLANPETRDEMRRIVYSFNNLARQLRLEREQLIQAAKLESVGRLAAGIAHEVKNPLAVILQGIDFLSFQPETKKEPYAQLVSDMRNAVLRADGVIRGLLDFSAPRQLTLKGELLNQVVEESLMLVRHEISQSNITLVKSLSPDLPRLYLDKNKVVQVLINLLTNACHAMPEGGTLSVRTLVSNGNGPGSALIEIEDTGTGIPENKMSKVFDPFYTTKPTGKGTGLGLSVVRSIVEMHKGQIKLANKPSGGVHVTVALPIELNQPGGLT